MQRHVKVKEAAYGSGYPQLTCRLRPRKACRKPLLPLPCDPTTLQRKTLRCVCFFCRSMRLFRVTEEMTCIFRLNATSLTLIVILQIFVSRNEIEIEIYLYISLSISISISIYRYMRSRERSKHIIETLDSGKCKV